MSKIKKEHAERMQRAFEVAQLDVCSIEARCRNLGYSPERFRWEVWSVIHPVDGRLVRDLYEYANDNHIDTQLRKIFRSSGCEWGSRK